MIRKIDYRIEQGKTVLRDLDKRIKELGGWNRGGENNYD